MSVSKIVTVDLTTVADAMDSGDVVVATFEIPLAARENGGQVVLESIVLLDAADQSVTSYSVHFLDSNVTFGTIDAAISISDANAANLIGFVSLVESTDLVDLIGCRAYYQGNLNLRMKAATGTTSLYGGISVVGTPTYAAVDDLHIRLAFRQY